MSTTIEIERKYDVTADFALPDLTTVTDVASVAPAVEHHLDAIYLDTSDHRLSAHRMTLRRRTGGHDSGWHLKQPTTGATAARPGFRWVRIATRFRPRSST